MKTSLLALTLSCLVLANAALAVRVSSIYKGSVPVASQSIEDRNRALPEALQQVLIKVSGDNHILNNPNVKSHLRNAASLLQAYSYLPNDKPNYPYLLEVQFYSEGINRLLRRASASIWGMNRPLILAWVEYEEPDHPAEIIDNDSQNEIRTDIKKSAEDRGIPLIFPIMDVKDINKVNVNDIVEMTIPTLQQASKRYRSDGILIIRAFKLVTGFSAQGKLLFRNEAYDWTITGKSMDEVLKGIVDNVTDKLAGRFASVVTNSVQSKTILTIKGILHQNDFSQMLNYLQRLPSVASTQIVQVTGDEVLLNINLRGSPESFAESLSVGNKLALVTSLTNDNKLVYQWNR